jgi:enoyl reductase-like protein
MRLVCFGSILVLFAQFPLALSLRREGYPIELITVAAGVPSPNVAENILRECAAAGINRIAFKPGSIDAINSVIAIAQRAAVITPRMHIVLQWTGGRSGGHHSLEDQHQPMLQRYAAIRSCPNIILVCGGGIGCGEDAAPYLSGQWSVRGYKYVLWV